MVRPKVNGLVRFPISTILLAIKMLKIQGFGGSKHLYGTRRQNNVMAYMVAVKKGNHISKGNAINLNTGPCCLGAYMLDIGMKQYPKTEA